MSRILVVTLLCVTAAAAATKPKTTPSQANHKRDLGVGSYNSHPEVLTVGQGHGHGGGGIGGFGGGGGGGGGGGWGDGGGVSSYGHGEYPALADVVALVLNLLVLAAFGGLVYLLLSPLLSGGHGGGGDDGGHGWGRATASTSPYYDAFKDGGLMTKVLNSIDYVDTTFAVMKISGDGCRKRVACEMERAAGRNKIFGYATNFFRNRMRSMDLYRDAMTSGDKQEDCQTLFPDCTYTLVDKVGKWIGN